MVDKHLVQDVTDVHPAIIGRIDVSTNEMPVFVIRQKGVKVVQICPKGLFMHGVVQKFVHRFPLRYSCISYSNVPGVYSSGAISSQRSSIFIISFCRKLFHFGHVVIFAMRTRVVRRTATDEFSFRLTQSGENQIAVIHFISFRNKFNGSFSALRHRSGANLIAYGCTSLSLLRGETGNRTRFLGIQSLYECDCLLSKQDVSPHWSLP